MLSLALHRQLLGVVANVHELIDRVQSDATTEEVELRVAAVRETLDVLQEMIGAGPTGSFDSMVRHLHFLLYYHRAAQPESYASDMDDLRERDLPGVIRAVEEWGTQLLDPRLVAATKTSWDGQHYGNAVRDAFICLEDALREAGGVDPGRGLSGDRLVTSVLGPSANLESPLRSDSFLGQLTSGESTGVYYLFKGAFLGLRNATAHRAIPYTATEAEDVVHLVNLCLRLLPSPTDQVDGAG